MIKALLRAFSYFFDGLLALLAIGVSSLSFGGSQLDLKFLPWTGTKLSWWLLALGVTGLVTLLLAMGGRLPTLFFLWNLGMFTLLLRGFFLTAYIFAEPVRFRTAMWLTLGALLATIGAWPRGRKPEPVRRGERWRGGI